MSFPQKPLPKEINGIKIIEDLGLIEYGNQGQLARYCICECPKCQIKRKVQFARIKRKFTKCKKCSTETHGFSRTRLYSIWKSMKSRCYGKTTINYKYYGGRGITICDEWLENFISFRNWALNNGYNEILSIDRTNNNLNYSPENCRWANTNTQNRNTRRLRITNTSGFRGVCKNKKYFKASIGINKKLIYLGDYKTALEAALVYDDYIINNNLEHTKNF